MVSFNDVGDCPRAEARIGARKISYSRCGQGPAVLMLHGGGPGASGMSNYGRNLAALSEKFTLIIPDMPGYGQSTKGLDGKDPFGDLAKSMLGLLDNLGIKQAAVVGNSLGGACALRMALDAPQRVSRLVLMGPGGIDTTRGLPTDGLKHLLDYYSGEGPTLKKLRQFIKEDLVYDASSVPDDVIQERFKASMDPEVVASPPLRRPRGIPSFRKIDFTRDPRLAMMQTPTLVLWGKEDKVNRPSGAQSLQKRLPNCDVYMFARTGHWVQWERAEEFNAVTGAFLSSDYLQKRTS
jgi:4,5:9,10-diseco-3-hydroxy-5,9,17-trioxoandrosta-1(10),2-diene-4-oate hydrolase